MISSDILREAQALVQRLANESSRQTGTGSMSVAIYDTAWVSMVSRVIDSGTHFIFPESLQYVLDNQSEEGGWESYASDVDGILNTAAALLALLKYQSAGQAGSVFSPDFGDRIARAKASLAIQLENWNLDSCNHVGFEILVPALLDMLGQHQIKFDFSGREKLLMLRDQKMRHFRPEILYSPIPTTFLHSLEAFIGMIDFDGVSHHKMNGSMMASPSSTAAYLMNCSSWDGAAEAYLRGVVTDGIGRGNGGVPSAFPSSIFEISWVLTTLLKAGFSPNQLGAYNLEILSDLLKREFKVRDGVVGFAPSLLADADDTSNTILMLNLLGKSVNPEQMILSFETKANFRTYPMERNASFSANCNILNALLHAPEPSQYARQISKAANFLCVLWNAGDVKDKWNLSPFYQMMLLAQTFQKLVILWGNGKLPEISTGFMRDKILPALFQILVRTLYLQNNSGSWGSGALCENSAYALLALIAASQFPWCQALSETIASAISMGRKFLLKSKDLWGTMEYTWVEKVTYGSGVLSKAYCLAASYAAVGLEESSPIQWSDMVLDLIHLPSKSIAKFSVFFSQIPLFRKQPKWQLHASLIEGYMYLPRLREMRLNIFPRENMSEDKYLEYIPFTWTSCNILYGAFLEPDLLWTMMQVSMLNYQVDEYMETAVESHFKEDLEPARRLIHRLCNSQINSTTTNGSVRKVNGDSKTPSKSEIMSDVEHTLTHFIQHILDYPEIQASSISDRTTLRYEIEAFLLAHLTQAEDNRQLSRQDQSPEVLNFIKPGLRYFEWVRGISSEHTSCPYAFSFITCLASQNGTDLFPDVEQKYLAQDLCRHLATLCRQYNDYGSIARDKAERNLNSINFVEFKQCGAYIEKMKIQSEEKARKDALFRIAEYERKCMDLAFEELKKITSKRVVDILGVFVNVTDLYGQIYVARDIASRMH